MVSRHRVSCSLFFFFFCYVSARTSTNFGELDFIAFFNAQIHLKRVLQTDIFIFIFQEYTGFFEDATVIFKRSIFIFNFLGLSKYLYKLGLSIDKCNCIFFFNQLN